MSNKILFSDRNSHRLTDFINILYFIRLHVLVTSILCSGQFSQNYAVYVGLRSSVDNYIL